MSDENKKIEAPARPEEPGIPPEKSRPDQPDQTDQPGQPGQPDQPDQTGQPGQTDPPDPAGPAGRAESEGRVERAAKALCAKCPEWKARLAQMETFAKLPGAALNRERGRKEVWLLAFFAFLGLLLLINMFARPEHPHFGLDSWWGFWPVFGLAVGAAMVFIMKRVIQPLIVRKEDYYGDL